MIPEDRMEALRNDLKERMVDSVKLVMFTQEIECKFCAETRQLAQELSTLNDKITTEVYNFMTNADKAKEFKVEKIPALVIMGKKDYGVRIYGVPYGYELQTLISAVVNVSRGTTDLSDKTKTILADVKSPVHIQVFVTLTCPHCPVAASIAHKLAIESDMISADVIDAGEFPTLAQKYAVIGVPKIIINEKVEFVGAFNEDLFAEHVLLGSFQ